MHNSQSQSGSADALKSGSAWTCHLNCTRDELRKAKTELILAVVQRSRHTATDCSEISLKNDDTGHCSGSKKRENKERENWRKIKTISYKYTLHITINSQNRPPAKYHNHSSQQLFLWYHKKVPNCPGFAKTDQTQRQHICAGICEHRHWS